jgi:hypothetical protein
MIGFIDLQDGVQDRGDSVQFIKRDAPGGAPEDGVGVNSPALELLLNGSRIEVHDPRQFAKGMQADRVRCRR